MPEWEEGLQRTDSGKTITSRSGTGCFVADIAPHNKQSQRQLYQSATHAVTKKISGWKFPLKTARDLLHTIAPHGFRYGIAATSAHAKCAATHAVLGDGLPGGTKVAEQAHLGELSPVRHASKVSGDHCPLTSLLGNSTVLAAIAQALPPHAWPPMPAARRIVSFPPHDAGLAWLVARLHAPPASA
jgi:hypothetical protein